jgi:hypothetical protein
VQTNQLTSALLGRKKEAKAHALFHETRQGEAREQDALVYNAGFSRPFSGSQFDWAITRQSGVAIERKQAGDGWALSIRFLDSPIRLKNVMQAVALEPGNYRLKVRYAASGLRMPKPVSLALSCHGHPAVLASIPFEGGDRGWTDAAADFTISRGDCPLHQVHVSNGDAAETWRNRYGGTLQLDHVSIEPVATQ